MTYLESTPGKVPRKGRSRGVGVGGMKSSTASRRRIASVAVAMTLAAAAAVVSVAGSAHADIPCNERPTNVTSTLNADHTAVEVAWDAPSGCTPDSYAVYRKILGSGDRLSKTATTTGSEFSYTDDAIEPGKTYRYRIRSNDIGRRSGRTDVDVPAQAPVLAQAPVPAQAPVLRDVLPPPQLTYVPPPEPEPEPLVAERQMHEDLSCPPGPASVNAAKASTDSPDIRVTWSSPPSISAACTDDVELAHYNNTLRHIGFDVWVRKATDRSGAWRLLNQAGELSSSSRSYTFENFRDAEYTFRVSAVYSYTDWHGDTVKAWSGYGEPLDASRATLTAERTDQPAPAYGEVDTVGRPAAHRYIAWGRPDVYEEFGTQFQVKWSIPDYSASGRFVVFHEVTRDTDVTANLIYICHDASNMASDSDSDWSNNLCSQTPVQEQDYSASPRVWPKGKFLLITDVLTDGFDRSVFEGSIRIRTSSRLSMSIRACSSRGCSDWLSDSD